MLRVKYSEYMKQENDFRTINRPNGSGDWLFLYFPRPMRIVTNDEEIITEKNACILFAPTDMHFFEGICGFINTYVHFEASESETAGIPHGKALYPNNFFTINSIAKEVQNELTMPDCYSDAMNEVNMRQILILLARSQTYSNELNTHNEEYERFKAMRTKILTDLGTNYSSEYLANQLHMSRTRFYELYKKFFNSSPKQDVLKMKMEKAATLLSDKSKTVESIAESLGFVSTEHFTRYYKGYFSHSPRTKHQ